LEKKLSLSNSKNDWLLNDIKQEEMRLLNHIKVLLFAATAL
jgi:hypothetical protein